MKQAVDKEEGEVKYLIGSSRIEGLPPMGGGACL